MRNTFTRLAIKCLLLVFISILSIDHAFADAPPVISSFSPLSGPVGTSVTISGSGFNTLPANNVVYFGATRAQVISATAGSLKVNVPAGATYKPISVLNTATHLLCYSGQQFLVTFAASKNAITVADIGPMVDFASGSGTYSMVVADVDGDGKPDLIVANSNINTVSVLHNISSGGAVTTTSFAQRVDFGTGGYPIGLAVADMDGDGKPDIVVSNQDDNTVSVLRNTTVTGSITTASFAAKVDFATGKGPGSLAVGDLDGDGRLDIAVTDNYESKGTVLHSNSVSGSITASSFTFGLNLVANSNPEAIAIGDMDGDGKLDVAITNLFSNNVCVYHNSSSGGALAFVTKTDFPTGAQPEGVTIGDIDGDGKPELIVSNYNGNSVSVYHNTASPGGLDLTAFHARMDFTTGTNPESAVLGDIDGDGKPDLVVSNNGSSTMSIFRNTATSGSIDASTFAASLIIPTDIYPAVINIADVNGDGKADIIVPAYKNNTISVYQNTPLITPLTQAKNIQFSNTGGSYTTVSWTNGSGASRAVFISLTTTGTPAPVDNTTYTGVISNYTYGTQIGNSGWYCVYNGTNNTVNISGLKPGATYRVMVVEHNGPPGSELYLKTTANGNPAAITMPVPPAVITASGSLPALNTTYGTASVTGTFNIAGTNMNAGILVTPPAGFEVSIDPSSGYGGSITVGGPGVIFATPVYIRLASTTAAGSYSGDVKLSSLGAPGVNVATTSSTMNKAPLSITANSVTKLYGTALAGETGATVFIATGLKNSETIGGVTISYGTGALAKDAVGSYTASVTASNAAGGTFKAGNYTITYHSGNIEITPLSLTVTATGPLKTYGVSLAGGPGSTDFTTTALPAGEAISSVTLTSDAAGLAAATPAGSAYTVTPSAAQGTGGFIAGNYIITYVPYNGIVNKAALTIAAAGINKTYDNNVAATVTLTDNRVNGDVFTTAYTAAFADKNVGTAKPVSITGIAISGGAAANYTVNATAAAIASITPASVTVIAQADTKVYDNTTNSATGPLVTGLIAPDVLSAAATQSFNSADAGTGKILTPAGVVINDGNGGKNYNISYTPNNSGKITAAVLTYTANPVSRNFGAANPVFTGTVTGFAGMDTQSSAANGNLTFNTTATAGSPAGNYPITGAGLSAANYTFTQAAGNSTALTITPVSSTDADLANLNISDGNLSPAFAAGVVSYTDQVNGNIGSVAVTPTAADGNATITINGEAVASGHQSNAIGLNIGENNITITVTAQDGFTHKTYTVAATRIDQQEQIIANNLLSPNGDGTNDKWVIKNIQLHPNNRVTVFDQNGRTVFAKEKYAGDWEGTYGGNILGQGTYYYVIDPGDGQKKITGFITILRDK